MTMESKYGFDKNLVFREAFLSEQNTRENGGVPTDVTFSDGVGGFNGSSSYLDYNNYGNKGNITSKNSIRIKFNSDSISSTQHLFSYWVGAITRQFIEIAASKIRFAVRDSSTITVFDITSNTVLESNTDYDIICVFGGSEGNQIYINGASEGISNTASNNEVFATNIRIGSQGVSLSRYLSGGIDLIEIYNTALTAEEVYNLYH